MKGGGGKRKGNAFERIICKHPIVVVKGDVPPDFRMLRVKRFRVLGEIDADVITEAAMKEQVK
jgi:hypothetical protein